MNTPPAIPPRLHVLFAPQSRAALVIRRGPSERFATIGWDRATDTFTLGQWLKGRLFPYRSDLSPSGKWLIYFAMGRRAKTYTAVAQAPYLKALDFYAKKYDTSNGGGLFLSENRYWLNEPPPLRHIDEQFKHTPLEMTTRYNGEETRMGESDSVYFRRLERDGWVQEDPIEPDAPHSIALFQKRINSCSRLKIHPKIKSLLESNPHSIIPFQKRINDRWSLIKQFHTDFTHSVVSSLNYDTHQLIDKVSEEVCDFPDWEWADVDKNRLVWAEHGKLMAARVNSRGLETPQELYDFNSMVYEERIAPY